MFNGSQQHLFGVPLNIIFSRFPEHVPSAGASRFKCFAVHSSDDIVFLPTIQSGHGFELTDGTLVVFGRDEKVSPPANVKSIDTGIH